MPLPSEPFLRSISEKKVHTRSYDKVGSLALNLTPGHARWAFSYWGPNYGYTTGWIPSGVTYADLPPGEYHMNDKETRRDRPQPSEPILLSLSEKRGQARANDEMRMMTPNLNS